MIFNMSITYKKIVFCFILYENFETKQIENRNPIDKKLFICIDIVRIPLDLGIDFPMSIGSS